jgi:hypothetical protein
MARPTKLTAKVQRQIVESIRSGSYAETAARSAGVSRRTYQRWLERGESDAAADRPFRAFRAQVRKAEADAELRAVNVIRDAMPNDWRAAMTYLERRYPERWRRREHVDVASDDAAEIRRQIEEMKELDDPEVVRATHDYLATIGRARERRLRPQSRQRPIDH